MAKINIDPDKLLTAEQKFDNKKEAKVADLNAYGAQVQNYGFAYDFGPEYGVLHLQLRNSDDKVNWAIARTQMEDAIAAGYGDMPVASIHTDENITVMVKPTEGLQVLRALSDWGLHLMQVSWAKKAEIRAAENERDLQAVDIEEGWDATN